MAVKNWLIRTKNKQILGPATKDKVIELIEKGSLAGDDEVACGNGYWFWVKEKDLLEKYLYGDLPQTFNPISEAVDVLTAKTSPEGVTASVMDSPQKADEKAESPVSNQLPVDDDLAYPDSGELDYPDLEETPENTFEDESKTGEIDLNATLEVEPAAPPAAAPEPVVEAKPAPRNEVSQAAVGEEGDDENYIYPSAADLEYPVDIHGNSTPKVEEFDGDQTDPNVQIPSESDVLEASADDEEEYEEYEEEEYEEEVEETPSRKGRKKRVMEARKGSDRYLIIIALLIAVAIAVVFYYYKMVLNKPFPIVGMSEAHAQTITSLSKKKVS
ncbi:MAG: hypothetical protein NXH75_00865 [Halobacteriovoraceae bacterium]|nr:hypothetical protein [Halobacteriovoraceae bacterium]